MSTAKLNDFVRSSIPGWDVASARLKVGDVILPSMWVLEWSQSQQAFHVETLGEALMTNGLSFKCFGKTGDYVILGLYPDRAAVDVAYDFFLSVMRTWDMSNLTVDALLKQLGP